MNDPKTAAQIFVIRSIVIILCLPLICINFIIGGIVATIIILAIEHKLDVDCDYKNKDKDKDKDEEEK